MSEEYDLPLVENDERRQYKLIEKDAFREYCSIDQFREQKSRTSRKSFNYLLLDSCITEDLPSRAEHLSECEVWNTFLSGIFYVGKGTGNRQYSHLTNALKKQGSRENSEHRLSQRILNIWEATHGVICLRVFQNSVSEEAYTREAALIEALGTQRLENVRLGHYYGIAGTWSTEEKRNFGRYLLHQAMKIFLHEGETQIFKENV